MNDTDFDLLSAYIDHQLADQERAALEDRMEREPELRLALDELRATVTVLRELPPVMPPRSFTLDPATVAPSRPWLSLGLLRFGSAVAAVLLALTFLPSLSGIGGAPAMQAPALAPMSGASSANEMSRAMGAATADPSARQSLAAGSTAEGAAGAAAAPAAIAAAPTVAAASGATAAPAAPDVMSAVVPTPAIGEAAPAPEAGIAAMPTVAPAGASETTGSGTTDGAAGNVAGAPPADTAGGSAPQAQNNGTTAQNIQPIATSGISSPGTTSLEQPVTTAARSAPAASAPIAPLRLAQIALALIAVTLGLASLWLQRRYG